MDAKNALILARQIREYKRISMTFDSLIKALLDKATGLSLYQIFKLEQYKQFVEQIGKQLGSFALYNSKITAIAQREFATMVTITVLR